MTRPLSDVDDDGRKTPGSKRSVPEPIALKGGLISARYGIAGPRTVAKHVREQGALRIRQPNGARCESILLNTAGGIVGGDRLSLAFTVEPHADVTVTSAAAEKVYRSDPAAGASVVEARFSLASGSRLVWVPQETILFDAARLKRSFVADLDASSELVVAELLAFGRREYGEHDIGGHLHDSWRVRRDGRLVFADETRLDGAIGRLLARGAVAGGCHASALVLVAGPHAAAHLDAVRAAIAAACADGSPTAAEGGATLKDGIIVARILATSAERARAILVAALRAIGVAIPRVWQ